MIHRHRVLYEDDTPIALATSWFSGALRSYLDADGVPTSSALIKTDSIPEGTAPYVERITGRTMTTAQDRLAARHATEVERRQLQLEEPAPILEVQHTVWDADDQPMTFEVNIVPANRWATYEYPVAPQTDQASRRTYVRIGGGHAPLSDVAHHVPRRRRVPSNDPIAHGS